MINLYKCIQTCIFYINYYKNIYKSLDRKTKRCYLLIVIIYIPAFLYIILYNPQLPKISN